MTSGPYFDSDPICLTLAADAQFCAFDPSLDAVWQLSLESAAPIALRTSFGLQAQAFELYPGFLVNNVPLTKIQEFFSEPRIEVLLPNYACLAFSPTPDAQVRYELWVARSDSLLGRLTLRNTSQAPMDLSARLFARLVPLDGGSGMSVLKQSFRPFLKGQSGTLEIALATDSNPNMVFSPLPGLEISEKVPADGVLSIQWRCAISNPPASASEKTFQPFPENWDAEIARLLVADQARAIQIETPLPDWDCAFQALQHTAAFLIRPGTPDTAPTLIRQRNTHVSYAQSFSASFPTSVELAMPGALELRQALLTLLPARAREASGILLNYLRKTFRNLEDPAIKVKRLPFPCLAWLTWQIFQLTTDRDFLARAFPDLKALTLAWFSPAVDSDQDGWPEWQSLEQTGLKSLTKFDLLAPENLPISITTAENLGLGVLLHAELTALQSIARFLEDSETLAGCTSRHVHLTALLAQRLGEAEPLTWWDRDTHLALPSKVIFTQTAYQGGLEPIFLDHPRRLHLQIRSMGALRKPDLVTLRGENLQGETVTEALRANAWSWLPGYFYAATNQVYRRLDLLKINQLEAPDVVVYTGNLAGEDASTCLAEAYQLLANPADTRFQTRLEEDLSATRYGIFEVPMEPEANQASPVSVGWNSLMLTQLLEAGEKKLAWELFSRLMDGIIRGLKQEHAVFEGFDAREGQPLGARNAAGGLLPFAYLLEIAGIRIYSPNKVGVSGDNPLPWPLKVRYRGWEITRDGKNTTVCLPDGTTRNHFGSSQKIFQLE